MTDALIKIKTFIAYLPFALPLLYIYPWSGAFATELWRATVVMAAASLVILISAYEWRSTRRPGTWQIVTALLVVSMLVSLLMSEDKNVSLFGIHGDYQGLLLQLGCLIVGWQASTYAKTKLYWQRAADITGIVCLISLIVDLPYVLNGYRLSGLLLHATGMGLYAGVALGLNFIAKPSRQQNVFIISSVLVIALSASRIGLLTSLMILSLLSFKLSRRKSLVVGVTLVCCVAISSLMLSSSQRLTDIQKIDAGYSYRAELYHWSVKHLDFNLLGEGPSQVSNFLMPRASDSIPPAIQQTLQHGYPIWYTHNQLLDFYIQYGLVGFALLGYLVVTSINKLWQRRSDPRIRPITILMAATLANLLVNTPSIELSPIMALALFSALSLKAAQ